MSTQSSRVKSVDEGTTTRERRRGLFLRGRGGVESVSHPSVLLLLSPHVHTLPSLRRSGVYAHTHTDTTLTPGASPLGFIFPFLGSLVSRSQTGDTHAHTHTLCCVFLRRKFNGVLASRSASFL